MMMNNYITFSEHLIFNVVFDYNGLLGHVVLWLVRGTADVNGVARNPFKGKIHLKI